MYMATGKHQRYNQQKNKVLSRFTTYIQCNRLKLAISNAFIAEATAGHPAGYQKKSLSRSKIATNTAHEPVNRSAQPGIYTRAEFQLLVNFVSFFFSASWY